MMDGLDTGTCKICHCKALISDNGYTVCEECGSIQGEDHITSEFQDGVGYQAASENNWTMHDKQKHLRHGGERTPEGYKYAVSKMKSFSYLFKFTPEMVENAESLFRKIYHTGSVLNVQADLKEYYALACLFIEGRKTNKILSYKEFGRAINMDIKKIARTVCDIQKKFCLPLPPLTFSEIAIYCINTYDIEKEALKPAIDIISICDRAWLFTGRQPEKIIWASLYISCKALFPVKYHKISFEQFMKQHNQHISGIDKERLREIKKVLKDIGETTLPWAINKKGLDFVFVNLIDILKYSKLCFMEKKRKVLQEIELMENCAVKRKIEDIDIFEPPILKSPAKVRKSSSYCADNEIPYTGPTKGIGLDNLGSDVEEELEGYIRSEKEIEEIQKARELCQLDIVK